MNGFCCLDCSFIFPFDDAGTKYVSLKNGGPATRYSCPRCQRSNLGESHVCPDCLSEEIVKGEEIGEHCLASGRDAVEDAPSLSLAAGFAPSKAELIDIATPSFWKSA